MTQEVAQTNDGKKRRSLRNLLIDPLVQVRLGLYSILLAVAFSAIIMLILYMNLAKFADIVMALTDVEDEIKVLFNSYMSDAWLWLVAATVVFLFLNIFVSIFYTHKLVGPTVAFSRVIKNLRNGEYGSRVFLRKGDAFSNVANELNQLAEKLETEKKP